MKCSISGNLQQGKNQITLCSTGLIPAALYKGIDCSPISSRIWHPSVMFLEKLITFFSPFNMGVVVPHAECKPGMHPFLCLCFY